MESTESGPKSKSHEEVSAEWKAIQEEWDSAIKKLTTNEADEEVLRITSGGEPDSLEKTEKFLQGNFGRLSQAQKDFLLTSLRVKKFKRDYNY